MAGIDSISSKIADTVIEAAAGYILDIRSMGGVDIQVDAVVNSTAKVMASATDINITTDTFTSTAHGYYTGLKGQFTTSSALPTGLSLATNYYIIVTGADTFQVASSLANALAAVPVPVDITAVGTGNQTFTPVSVSGCSYKLQKSSSYNPVTATGNFIDLVSGETNSVVTNNISATSNTSASAKQLYATYAKILFAISAGSVQIKVYGSSKGL